MWIFVFFDLPVTTKKEMKAASLFRKNLEKDGFAMMQFSVYIRHCASRESMEVHIKRIKSMLPESGKVSILTVTDRQYGEIYNFWGVPKSTKLSKITKKIISEPVQLEFFQYFCDRTKPTRPFFIIKSISNILVYSLLDIIGCGLMQETDDIQPSWLPANSITRCGLMQKQTTRDAFLPQATPPADGKADATPPIYIIRYISAPNPAPLCMAEEKMGIEGLEVNVFL